MKSILNTKDLSDTIRSGIIKNRTDLNLICQISSIENDSLFICEVYELNYKILKSNPALFCNFRMYYTIDNCRRIKVVEFDKRIVM